MRQIFSRLSNRDEAEANLSTFASEMKTMAQVIESAGPENLVLIDELGRNTSTHEGIGIAHAISEVLIGNNVHTIFATHFVQLNATLSPYPAVKVQQFSVELNTSQEGSGLVFQHKLSTEGYEYQHYGIALAKMCQLPGDLLRDAEETAKKIQLAQNTKEDQGEHRTHQMVKRKDIISEVCVCQVRIYKLHADEDELLHFRLLSDYSQSWKAQKIFLRLNCEIVWQQNNKSASWLLTVALQDWIICPIWTWKTLIQSPI